MIDKIMSFLYLHCALEFRIATIPKIGLIAPEQQNGQLVTIAIIPMTPREALVIAIQLVFDAFSC